MNQATKQSRILSAVRFVAVMQILLLAAKPVHPFGLFSKSNRSSASAPPAPSSCSANTIQYRMSSIAASAAGLNSPEDEVSRQLERARAALAVSRAKLAARDEAVENEFAAAEEAKNGNTKATAEMIKGPLGPKVPFFASQSSNGSVEKKSNGKREKVIKNQNDDGLFTTDGDLMAKLSEEEEWESRPLLEVFQNERKEEEKVNTLADRDVAANIFNLRKQLQTDDFMRIFDKRNRFIGEP